MSFLDDENQMLIDATIETIAYELFDAWNNSNLDEGEMFADWRIAQMSGDIDIMEKFNKYYELNEGDEYYL